MNERTNEKTNELNGSAGSPCPRSLDGRSPFPVPWGSWVRLIGTQVLAVRCQAPWEGMELGDTGITVGSPGPKCFLYLAQVLESNHSEVFWRQGQNSSLCARTIFVGKMTLNFLTLLPSPLEVLGLQGLQTRTTTPSYCSLPRKDKACFGAEVLTPILQVRTLRHRQEQDLPHSFKWAQVEQASTVL